MSKTKIVIYDGMGRGVQAEKDLEQGEIVCVCELLVLSPEDTVITNTTILKHYTLGFNENQECLALGLGSLFNHSETPNVGYALLDQWYNGQSRTVMVFRASKDIPKGEQLFINYNSRTKSFKFAYKHAQE